MNDNYKCFLDNIESVNTRNVAYTFKNIGNYDYSNCTVEDLENIILSFNPNSARAITTIMYVMRSYFKYLKNDNLISMLKGIKVGTLWNKAKDNTHKFISFKTFNQVLNDIELYEELNILCTKTLFWSIYEGIYNNGMSVLKNLRASDIHENVVTLRNNDGEVYDLEVTNELAHSLKELSTIDVIEKVNRYSFFYTDGCGKYTDSCFKIEKRKNASTNEDRSYCMKFYRILDKISKEYIGYSVTPNDIFISGIMHRIKIKLDENNIDLQYAFSNNCRNAIANKCIAEELERCKYVSTVSNFKFLVKGRIDVFME